MTISTDDIATLDNIYVRKDECGEAQKMVDIRLADGMVQFALINKELVWIKWLLFASVGERLLSFIAGKLLPFWQ
ncbi:MAG: hypothetical protein RR263_00445 [Oscillospiraceae bacterium]